MSEPTSSPEKYLRAQVAETLNRKGSVAKWALAFLVASLTAAFLFFPCLEVAPPVPPVVPPRAVLPPVDLYFLRDASASPNFEDYQRIEDDIFRHVDTRESDRVSFASFGGANDPLDIQPASRASATIAAARDTSRNSRFAMTDFAKLFTELRQTLVEDRATDPFDAERQGISHRDLVVVLSDGVHDPANWNRRCPDEFVARGREFVPQDVRRAFGGLAGIPGAKVQVYLVIAGEDNRCTPRIRSEWLLALGGEGLQVLTFGEARVDAELGTRIFKSLERSRATLVQPFARVLSPEQRSSLDRNQGFWVEYRFRPILGATEIKVFEARLFESAPQLQESKPQEASKKDALLHSIPLGVSGRPSQDYDAGPLDFSPLSIELAEPKGSLIGESIDKILYFQTRNDVEPGYSPEKSYSLRLVLESDACEVLQEEVLILPHQRTLVTAGLRRRVIWVSTCCALVAILGWLLQRLLNPGSVISPWVNFVRPSIWMTFAVVCVAIFVSRHLLSVLYLATPFLSALPRQWLRRKVPRFNLEAYRDWLKFFLPNVMAAWWL